MIGRLHDKSKCMYVNSVVGNKRVTWLVDTGASPNLINVNMLNKVKSDEILLREYNADLITADGNTKMQVFGITDLEVDMGGNVFCIPLVVAELGDIDAIIGMDFIWEWGFNMNIHSDNPSLRSPRYDIEIPLVAQDVYSDQCCRIVLHESVLVESDTEQVVIGRINRNKSVNTMKIGLAEPVNSLVEKTGVLLSCALVDTQKQDIILTCANFTDKAVKLKQGTTLALLKPVATVATVTNSTARTYEDMSVDDLPEHLREMARNASEGLSVEQCRQMCGMINENKDVFVGSDGKLGRTSVAKHSVVLNDDIPVRSRPYRPPLSQRKLIEEEIENMLENDVIEASDSPYASPVVLVTKKDGSPRFCVDYRALNQKISRSSWPIPNISDCLDTLSGSTWFSTLDLASAYWQCEIEEKDRHKTAFITHKGLYQFKVLPFGLSNSPACFEALMEKVLHGLQWERCLIYLDDIVAFGRSWELAVFNLQCIFDRLRSANLKLKPKKCTLFRQSVVFLGFRVSKDGVTCDESKIEAVRNWKVPTNVTEVRAFVGFCNYYRRFIKSFAHISAPLTELTKKGKEFVWTEDCQDSFDTLIDKLVNAPVVAYPSSDISDEFTLDCDSSDVAMGAVLSQKQNGIERVIAYGSKTLSQSQRKYCTTYKELLSVVTFVKQFRQYLLGVKFTIRTDHHSLKWLMNFKDSEGLVGRWLMSLQQFNFEIVHRPGKLHVNADSLSRQAVKVKKRRCGRELCPECPTGSGTPINMVNTVSKRSRSKCDSGTQTDSFEEAGPLPRRVEESESRESEILESSFESNADEMLNGSVDSSDIVADNEEIAEEVAHSNWVEGWSHEKLIEMQQNDHAIKRVLDMKREFEKCPSKNDLLAENSAAKDLCSQWNVLEIRNDLLYRRWVPKCVNSVRYQLVAPLEIRQEVFRQLHCVRAGGHLGVKRTMAKIRQRFFWPHCKSDIDRWCLHCEVCAQVKPGPKHKAELHHVPVRNKLERVALDVLGELPETRNGNKYVLVACDYYTKWSHAMAMPDQTAQTIADVFTIEFITVFGAPLTLHSDQGPAFESNLFREVCKLLDIEKSRTVPYRPESDGQVERQNRTLQQMLKCYINQYRNDWDDHLPYLNMAYRASPHESTGCSPNLMMFGSENNLPIDVIAGRPPCPESEIECPIEYVNWLQNTLLSVYKYASEQLETSAQRRKKYYDLKSKPTKYRCGQYVWRYYPPAAKGKFGKGWVGPMRVVECPTDIHCILRMSPDDEKLIRVHVDSLKHYHGETPQKWVDYESSICDNVDDEMDLSEDELGSAVDPVSQTLVQSPEEIHRDEIESGWVDRTEGDVREMGDNEAGIVSEDEDIEEQEVVFGRGRRIRKPPMRYSP